MIVTMQNGLVSLMALELNIAHTGACVNIIALFQSEKSYIFALKSPETVYPGGIINTSTRPTAPAKDRGRVRL